MSKWIYLPFILVLFLAWRPGANNWKTYVNHPDLIQCNTEKFLFLVFFLPTDFLQHQSGITYSCMSKIPYVNVLKQPPLVGNSRGGNMAEIGSAQTV